MCDKPCTPFIRMKYVVIITCGILIGIMGSFVVKAPPATQLAQGLEYQQVLTDRVNNLETSVKEIKKEIQKLKGK